MKKLITLLCLFLFLLVLQPTLAASQKAILKYIGKEPPPPVPPGQAKKEPPIAIRFTFLAINPGEVIVRLFRPKKVERTNNFMV